MPTDQPDRRLEPMCGEHRLALGRCLDCDGWDRRRACWRAVEERDGEIDPTTGELPEQPASNEQRPGPPPPGQAEPRGCEVPPRLQPPAGRSDRLGAAGREHSRILCGRMSPMERQLLRAVGVIAER